jgi:hypothetical protein
LVDGIWLAGLAGGQNQTYIAGVTANNAASQTTATAIASGLSLVEVDTAVATGSVNLPAAVAGTEVTIINNTAVSINVYASPIINQTTGALDTINALPNANPLQPAANSVTWLACAKNGHWLSK